jgi:hypothetical protein
VIAQSASTLGCTGGTNCTLTVTCSGSLKVTGGGLKVTALTGTAVASNMHLSQSYPSSANSWTVVGDNIGGGTITIQAIAICAQ